MNDITSGITQAIAYIEANLTERLEVTEIAKRAYLSPFHFQRIFGVLCGFTVGEYIRNRRLALAAEELSNGARVIDTALKYGYESPDSFARAFTRFHGCPPSAAKEQGAGLKSFAPLKIKLSLEGGTMLEYSISQKPAFTVVGISRSFDMETSYAEIPKYWQEFMTSADSQQLCGEFGICMHEDDYEARKFDYYIADMYLPWKEYPAEFVTRTIPAGTWAVFPCRGPLAQTLQSVNTRIWQEWLPACREYKLAGNYNIEMYTPPAEKPEDTYCEIWVPVVKA
ncbi:MAG: AraC family transcriptional regulator [Oscillospiraceae bacterium]